MVPGSEFRNYYPFDGQVSFILCFPIAGRVSGHTSTGETGVKSFQSLAGEPHGNDSTVHACMAP